MKIITGLHKMLSKFTHGIPLDFHDKNAWQRALDYWKQKFTNEEELEQSWKEIKGIKYPLFKVSFTLLDLTQI